MRTSSTTTITGAVLTTLLFAFPAFAHQHTALNGTWTLVPAKSDFAGQPVIQTGTVTINERDGDITVSRNFTYEGATDTFFYRDITDSENSATIHTGKDLKTKTRWDHDVLKVTTTNNNPARLLCESYTLAADGTMLVSVDKAGSQADHSRLPAQIVRVYFGFGCDTHISPVGSQSTMSIGMPRLQALLPGCALPWMVITVLSSGLGAAIKL